MEAWEYYVIAFGLAIAALSGPVRRPHPIAWGIAFLILLIFIGLRHKVGMDWNNYLRISNSFVGASLGEALGRTEPGFALLLWSSVKLGLGVYGANFVGSAILCAGLFRYARSTPEPWLGLLVAFPILITAVATSANRQAIAIGILMWLLSNWKESSLRYRAGLILLATTFHASAAFLLVFAALELNVRPLFKVSLALVLAAATLVLMSLTGGGDYYVTTYVTQQGELTYSPGAIQHVLFNAIPAMVMFAGANVRKRVFTSTVITHLALLALVLLPVALFASVAASRISLYLFPVGIAVATRVPELMSSPLQRALVRTLIVIVLLLVLGVWLNYSNTAFAHVPYDNALFINFWELQL